MTALSPGTSPPPVRTPIRRFALAASRLRFGALPPSACSLAHGFAQGLQPYKRRMRMHDDARRHRCQITAKTPLGLEALAKLRARQELRDTRRDTAGKV